MQYKDVRVRNVPTNIRSWGGGTERYGNSIFIFEIAHFCIAHLGHLHHTLTQEQLNEIDRVDVVMDPVDGTLTLDLEGMVEVLRALKAPLIISMHYFSAYTLDRFLQWVRQGTWRSPRGRRFWSPRPACQLSRKSWSCPGISAARYVKSPINNT